MTCATSTLRWSDRPTGSDPLPIRVRVETPLQLLTSIGSFSRIASAAELSESFWSHKISNTYKMVALSFSTTEPHTPSPFNCHYYSIKQQVSFEHVRLPQSFILSALSDCSIFGAQPASKNIPRKRSKSSILSSTIRILLLWLYITTKCGLVAHTRLVGPTL